LHCNIFSPTKIKKFKRTQAYTQDKEKFNTSGHDCDPRNPLAENLDIYPAASYTAQSRAHNYDGHQGSRSRTHLEKEKNFSQVTTNENNNKKNKKTKVLNKIIYVQT
jgi:hypothetical protein